jgi:hypothetical protein
LSSITSRTSRFGQRRGTSRFCQVLQAGLVGLGKEEGLVGLGKEEGLVGLGKEEGLVGLGKYNKQD